jgi:acid phosphatase (class A)
MRNLALCSVVLLCLGATQALALSDKPYLGASDADFGNLLPPPPADGSPLDKRDLQGVLDLQKNLTPARMEHIQADLEQTVYRVAGEVLGPTSPKTGSRSPGPSSTRSERIPGRAFATSR